MVSGVFNQHESWGSIDTIPIPPVTPSYYTPPPLSKERWGIVGGGKGIGNGYLPSSFLTSGDEKYGGSVRNYDYFS
jgi:hypothetical protein